MSKLRHLGLRGRSAGVRFTALYVVLFVLSGAGLLAITNLLVLRDVTHAAPAGNVQQQGPKHPSALAAARQRVSALEAQLDEMRTQQTQQFLGGSAVALAVMTVISVGLGRVVAGRVLRPLRTITTATRRISADNLHERLSIHAPPDEVKDLADTIDSLLGRLEGSFAAQRRFVANASHELRTPLATMRAALDVAVAKPAPIPAPTLRLADRLRTELDHIDRLLEGLLLLARTQHTDLPDPEAVSLGRLALQALDARAADIAGKRLTVDHRLPNTVWTRGSRTLLSRMIDNVIDNAVTHNQDGGWIRVTATAEGPAAQLVVETGGPLLDPPQVARLAQPFQRLGTERTGTGSGLGLSIVSAIATTHGGGLDLSARPDGGLLVTITLPLAPAPAGVPA
ncbi:HAMP domain-containing sensor histidine kinase [Plantactinospora sp. ZYX-F-223]|uniref:sensor histidine kinase n=1 Tax=Plantactinospora sp. ZYX-F-223 TaxID=3144103 RepID=UPI0031FC1A0A